MNVALTHLLVHTTVSTAGLATTILAALGVVLALASLCWQAVSFRLSGSRIRVEIRAGATDGVRVISLAGELTADQARSLQQQGLTQPVLVVEVANSGRAPTTVMRVDLLFPNGATFTGSYLPGSPELPSRMDGESEHSWVFDSGFAVSAAKAFEDQAKTGRPWVIRGQAALGGKKKPVVSKNDVRIL